MKDGDKPVMDRRNFVRGIGAALSVALTGIWMAVQASRRRRGASAPGYNWGALPRPPAGRGDIPLWVSLVLFIAAGTGYILLVNGIVNAGWLGGFPKPPTPAGGQQSGGTRPRIA